MTSKKTSEWREQNKEFIEQWQQKIKEVRLRISLEGWSEDKFEMEIYQAIVDQKLANIFLFAKNYIFKYKRGYFRNFMARVHKEIILSGTLEPAYLNHVKLSIETARRKMKW